MSTLNVDCTETVESPSPAGRGRHRAFITYRPGTPGVILGVLAALLVVRIPFGFLLFVAVPWILVLTGAMHTGTAVRALPLKVLLGWCLGAAALSILLLHMDAATSASNNVVIMLGVIGYTLVVHRSEQPGLTARRALEGLYWGAVVTWIISLGEIITGIKLLPILYPGANTVTNVESGRFVTSATYPNINDFCVVLAMLFVAVLAKLWFAPARGMRNIGRWFMLLCTLAQVIVMGSRGALLGCIIGFALLVVLNVRRQHRAALGWRAAIYGGGLIVVGGIALLASPYIQDHSTAKRGMILDNALAMLAGSPPNMLLGYGSLTSYLSAAQAAYGGFLMDPHNLLLEITLNYGLPALVLFVVVWLWVLVRGFLPRTPMIDWQTAFGLTVVVLLPVLGVVPSSTLRYHFTWVYIAATCLLVVEGRRTVSASASPGRDLENAHHDETDHHTSDDSHNRRAE